MSGVLDLHTLLVLQNGWVYYTDPANYAKWAALFKAINSDTLVSWYAEMRRMDNHFRTHYSPGTGQIPCIVVSLAAETSHMDLEPLGWEVGGDVPESTMLLNQVVRVSCFAKNPEMARALHVTVRAILLASVPRLLQADYLNFQYEGGEELTPEEELIADEMGIFVRKQTWKALAEVNVATFDAVSELQEWWVLWEKLVTIQNPDPHQTAPVDIGHTDAANRILPPADVAGEAGGVVDFEEN